MPTPPPNIAEYVDALRLKAGGNVDASGLLPLEIYATRLSEQRVPIIFDERHFCQLVGYEDDFVYACANATRSFYREFSIPKRSVGFRKISEPLPSLKEIQRWITR